MDLQEQYRSPNTRIGNSQVTLCLGLHIRQDDGLSVMYTKGQNMAFVQRFVNPLQVRLT